MKISVKKFEQILPECRSKETSGDMEGWSPENPSHRQCDVTALLSHTLLGYDIYAEKVLLESGYENYHYFNKNKKNKAIRLCEEQFVQDKIIQHNPEKLLKNDRIDIFLSLYPDIKQRYTLLEKKFLEKLSTKNIKKRAEEQLQTALS
ncbi:MAG: hypothetical protein NT085_00575 [candidate division SR1 bacterium]|nr:hypothetical protein [candidate division SR1 bacterium]